ncbi:RnfABCDGE type electron transport complex subunit G [Clostridium sp.]|uniref:RnfABCDGE type electron transport complex subunit G n=1 Tax=Clostridium sp. TaxID=1506 RepID=UPI00346490F3
MKSHIKIGIILCIVTTIAGVLLGFSYEGTKELIKENSKIDKKELEALMPEATTVEIMDIDLSSNEYVKEILEGVKDDTTCGYLIKTISKGFHGDVEVMVSLDLQGTVNAIKVLSHSETPGVGSKIEKKEFSDKFKLKKGEKLSLVKTSTSKSNEVEGISGATVSSTAVVNGVNEALKIFNSTLKKGA